jgi:trk system potassium uptake protein TrkH
MMTMAMLITIGTLGITVIYDLVIWPRERSLSLHTRLVLPLVLFLTVVGTLLVMINETYVDGKALAGLAEWNRWLLAFFSVVSSRTAGLTFINVADLGQASQLMLLIWMFIGGAPASMAGGVGLTTVAVVMVTFFSNVRGYSDVRVFHRLLPTETVLKAVAILTVSTTLVVSITIALLLLDTGELLPIAFEVISAFSNTGYSFGLTSDLNNWSRILLIFTMFWGRLGPLTLVVALAQRHRQTLIHYAEEKIIIG